MKIKRLLPFTLIFSILLGNIAFAESIPSLNVDAKAAILMEPTTGKILLEQNSHEQLAPASVTKVMTILLIYESIDNGKIKWEDVVTVSAHAASMGGSQIYLEAMEQQTVADLTKSIVVASANDAAVAMAEFIAGSEEGFVVLMNQKAKDLGMKDSNFLNACGLDTDGHLTSAYDIATMSRELITKYPQVFDYSKIWMDSITHKTARGSEAFGLSNTNKLIRSYSGATGLKTGSTSVALYCISATAERDNMQLIAVVLGAPDPNVRFHEAVKMLDFGFAGYSIIQGDDIGASKGTVKIFKGNSEDIPVEVGNKTTCLVPKGKVAELESKMELLEGLNAPVEKGTKAGEVVYFYEGKEVGRSNLITSSAVEKASLSDILMRVVNGWFDF